MYGDQTSIWSRVAYSLNFFPTFFYDVCVSLIILLSLLGFTSCFEFSTFCSSSAIKRSITQLFDGSLSNDEDSYSEMTSSSHSSIFVFGEDFCIEVKTEDSCFCSGISSSMPKFQFIGCCSYFWHISAVSSQILCVCQTFASSQMTIALLSPLLKPPCMLLFSFSCQSFYEIIPSLFNSYSETSFSLIFLASANSSFISSCDDSNLSIYWLIFYSSMMISSLLISNSSQIMICSGSSTFTSSRLRLIGLGAAISFFGMIF